MLMAQAEVAVAVAAASQATAASAAACANVTKVETAVAAEHSAGIGATAIEAALVQTKKDCDTAKALAKNLTEAAAALNATAIAAAHNETAMQIHREAYEAEEAKKEIAEQMAYDAAMAADIAVHTASEATKVNATKNFTALLHVVAIVKHNEPITEAERAEITGAIGDEVHLTLAVGS